MELFRKFFGIDLRTLALFRVGLGIIILFDLLIRLNGFYAFYTDDGIVPRARGSGPQYYGSFSLHMMSGQAWVQGVLFLIAAVLAVMLIVGYRTRLVTILSWFMMLSLQNRNTYILQLSDTLQVYLTFWAIFLPLGARFSIDAALSKAEIKSNQYCSVATFAILIQAMYVYFIGALLKTGSDWTDGTAVYYAMHWNSYATHFGVWFRQFGPLLKLSNYFVLYLELFGPILMFLPFFTNQFRLVVMFLIICMHIGFALFLNIGMFPAVSILSIMNFLPSEVWDRRAKLLRTQKRRGVVMYYDGDCNFCRKVCLIFRTFFLLPETPILIAQDHKDIYPLMQKHNSWVVEDYDGKKYVKWDAVTLVLKRSFLFWPLAYIFEPDYMKKLGNRLYKVIADNRAYLGNLTATLLPYGYIKLKLSKLETAFVSACIAVVMLWNITALVGKFPSQLWPVADFFSFYHWSMFAPAPPHMSNWYVVRGVTKNGKTVDVFNNREEPPSFATPEYIFEQYEDYRWRKFMQELRWESFGLQHEYGRYLCRNWDKNRLRENQLRTLEVYVNEQFTLADYRGFESRTRRSFGYNCETRKIF